MEQQQRHHHQPRVAGDHGRHQRRGQKQADGAKQHRAGAQAIEQQQKRPLRWEQLDNLKSQGGEPLSEADQRVIWSAILLQVLPG